MSFMLKEIFEIMIFAIMFFIHYSMFSYFLVCQKNPNILFRLQLGQSYHLLWNIDTLASQPFFPVTETSLAHILQNQTS